MDIVFFAIAAIVFLWIINRWKSRAFIRLAYKVPSNRWHTFLGWGKILSGKDILQCMYKYGKKYGPNSVYWIGPFPFFLSTDPQILKEILTSKNCIDKPMLLYNGFTRLVGQGIITESEPIWSKHRKLLNRAFSHKILISFFHIFHREANTLIEQIQRSLNKEGMLEYIADICFTQIMTINWIRKLADIFLYKTASNGVNMFRRLVVQSMDILQKKDTTDPSYLPEVNSVLEHALSGTHQNLLKVDEIEGQMMHLFAGATETTSSTLFFVLSLLAMHEEYQERAYEEIISILADDDDSVITLQQVNQLYYLDMILNETMRILPVVPMVFRKVTNEDLSLSNGLTLPVDQYICIDIFRLHRSKELWGPDADAFNPDNFLPINVAARHPYSFIPFTKGQRYCIGWRYAILFVKISLAKLIKAYKFTTDFKYENLTPENRMTLRLVEEPRLHIERRKVRE
ncbi:probable cytochrome P450 313a4 [Calliphora vicina]|uniref:probable cytochrome P450 313a4 n=1 Tax=Calliphora vicina TaxID=7373 RepID=UPI00325AF8AD